MNKIVDQTCWSYFKIQEGCGLFETHCMYWTVNSDENQPLLTPVRTCITAHEYPVWLQQYVWQDEVCNDLENDFSAPPSLHHVYTRKWHHQLLVLLSLHLVCGVASSAGGKKQAQTVLFLRCWTKQASFITWAFVGTLLECSVNGITEQTTVTAFFEHFVVEFTHTAVIGRLQRLHHADDVRRH